MEENKQNKMHAFIKMLGFSNASYWGKLVRVLFYGFLGGLLGLYVGFLQQGTKFALSPAADFIIYLGLFTYFSAVLCERSIPKIRDALSPFWKRVLGTTRYVYWSFWVWFAFSFVVIGIQQLQSSLLQTVVLIWVYMFILLLGIASVYPIAVYIPTCQFVTSKKIDESKKKEIAGALAILTPILGLPLFILTYLLLPSFGINNSQYWIIVLTAGIVYSLIYIFFVDLPYALSIKEKRRIEIDTLEKKKLECIENLSKISGLTVTEMLMKMNCELEVGRIEREKAKIESESIHPFKLTVPIAGLAFTAFSPLIIELLKKLFGS